MNTTARSSSTSRHFSSIPGRDAASYSLRTSIGADVIFFGLGAIAGAAAAFLVLAEHLR